MSTKLSESKTCAVCIHWNVLDSESGECRRQPPQRIAVKLNEHTHYETHFPVSKKDDWCGEFTR